MKNSCSKFRKPYADLRLRLRSALQYHVFWGRHTAGVPKGSIVFFPCQSNLLCCGLTGIVSIKHKQTPPALDMQNLKHQAQAVESDTFDSCTQKSRLIKDHYLSGREGLEKLYDSVRNLKRTEIFQELLADSSLQRELLSISDRLHAVLKHETGVIAAQMGHLSTENTEIISGSLDTSSDPRSLRSRSSR